MSTKTTISLLVAFSLFVAPFTAAASNDLTLQTSTILSVGGYSLTVVGTSAVVDSITVNLTTFVVTLSSGSSISVSSATKQILATDAPAANITGDVCNTSSTLTLGSSSGTVVVTVTPGAGTCTVNASGNAVAAISSGGSGGGGGGNGAPVGLLGQHTQQPISNVVTITPGISTSTATVTTAVSTPSPVFVFTRNLTIGAKGADVMQLQIFLNTHGFPVALAGAGSLGKETTLFGSLTRAALIKYQKAKSITPAVGYFGPLTRATLAK